MEKIRPMTVFLNPTENSYKRLGLLKAPRYISWSPENRSQLIRVPAAVGEYRRVELRSPDPTANPYLAFMLMIYAGLYGLENDLTPPEPVNINFYKADNNFLKNFPMLPSSLKEARITASADDFIREHIPDKILDIYCNR